VLRAHGLHGLCTVAVEAEERRKESGRNHGRSARSRADERALRSQAVCVVLQQPLLPFCSWSLCRRRCCYCYCCRCCFVILVVTHGPGV
jgi:hypothetical protein